MNKPESPLVSIVTPVYNGEKFIDECIQSVLAQTYQNWEYIILNNCSSDRTLEIAEKYAAADSRIHVSSNRALLPMMKNWNQALHCMSPESRYCKIVHADDLLMPKCVERMVALAEDNPSVGLVGSYCLWGNRVVSDGLPYSKSFFSGKEIGQQTLLNRIYCFWSPSALLIRSNIIRKRDQFYNETRLHADVEACYEILKESDFSFVHQVLTFIRKHDESMTNTVAAPDNQIILNNLDLFTRYGPIFLDQGAYHRHLSVKLNAYYHFLARSLFNLREKKFWTYHKAGIREAGHTFSKAKLLKAVISELVHKPVATVTALSKALIGWHPAS